MLVLVVVTLIPAAPRRRGEMADLVAIPAVVLDQQVDMVLEEDLEIMLNPMDKVMVVQDFILAEMVVEVEEVVMEQTWQEDIMVNLEDLVVMAVTAAVEAAAVKVGMET
jgi:hypothetical protein